MSMPLAASGKNRVTQAILVSPVAPEEYISLFWLTTTFMFEGGFHYLPVWSFPNCI